MVISPANDTHHSTSKNIRTNFKVFSHLKINKVCYSVGMIRGPQRIFCDLDTEQCQVQLHIALFERSIKVTIKSSIYYDLLV